MRYSKSMIEAVQQVGLYEMMDYAIIDGDNKIIGLYKGNMAKKQAQINLKGAEKQVQIKKPVKVIPVSNKKKGDTVIGIGEQPLTDKDREAIDEDVKNALAGFDNRAREAGSMDKKDIIKAKELYKRKDVKRLRQHIYSLDTEPLETIMQNISVQDRKFFDKMYPKNKSGQFLAMIAYDHRKMDEELDEKREPESKSDFLKRNKKAGYAAADKKIAQMKKDRMKNAKVKLKMGESLDEKFVDKDPQGKKFGWVIFNTKTKELIAKADDKKTIEKMKQRFERMGEPVTMMTFSKAFQYNEEVIKEDGHTDVSSAVRQCKTIVEDATQMMGKLQSMNGEESLPTWWSNKLAVASNSMNKIRDYLLVPSMQEGLNEREKGIDKLPRQFLNPDKEVMVMKKNKVIVIDKKDQDRYTKQGWELAEVLDKEDEPKVKEIVKKLKGASKAHAGQAKDLEKAVSETTITGKDLLENKYKEEKNGAQHFSKIEEDNYVWNFVYDDFGRTKLTTEPDKATHLVYTMEGKDNPQLLKLSEKEILDYKKGENYELSKKK